MKISIVLPAFNEADSIQATLNALERYMASYQACDSWQVIVVNDGSTDDTLRILQKNQKERKWLQVVDLKINFGRGRALRSGFAEAGGDVIVSLDADLSYAPYHIERMVSKLIDNNADIVIASAYGKGGSTENVPFKRLWLSRLGNKILSFMYNGGISVLTCIARAYKKEFIRKLDLHSDDKNIHLEILYKAKILNAKILEVPADLKWPHKELVVSSQTRRPTLKFKKHSGSHMFFGLLNRPGLIFFIPANILLGISALIAMLFVRNISGDVFTNGISIYHGIRNSMLNATPSWLTMSLCFILSIQFFSLGFLTSQIKKQYEETYKTLNDLSEKIGRKD